MTNRIISQNEIRLLAKLGWLYLAFILLVSTLPLQLETLTLVAAAQHAQANFHGFFAVDSYSAWFSNLVLFVPLPFFFAAALSITDSRLRDWSQILLLSFGFFVFTLFIEFIQLFIKTRTTSATDVVAEMLGVLGGWLLWWGSKNRFYALYFNLYERFRARTYRTYFMVYFIVLSIFSVLPFDITINPIELFQKLTDGRLVVVPFYTQYQNYEYAWLNFIWQGLIWLPGCYFIGKDGVFTRFQIVSRVFLLALFVEILQFFVFSRTTDITDCISALCMALGFVAFAPRLDFIDVIADSRQSLMEKSIVFYLLSMILSSLIFIAIFSYPFEFVFASELIKPAIPYFFTTPINNTTYASVFFNAQHLAWQLAAAIPFGVFTAIFVRRLNPALYFVAQYSLLGMILGVFIALEIVQIAVPGQTATLVDALLSWLSAVLCCMLFNRTWSAKKTDRG